MELGEFSSVWPYAVLRGDYERIVVGRESNIQDGVVVHADPGYPTIIGDRVTVGHRAVVHGAVIGSNTLIGIGAVVLNGAKIGEWCIIGAGAVVTEGATIPSGSIALGVPAKVIRTVTDKDKELIKAAAEDYVARTKKMLGL
ncbi:MAG: gamma carbonic anhydrase family protein [Candidatus Nezhaarchaeales archaeon]